MAELPSELDDTAELMDSKVSATISIRVFDNGYVDFDLINKDEVDGVNPVTILGALDLVKYSITVGTVKELGRITKVIGEKREKIRAQHANSSIITDELILPAGGHKDSA